MRQLFFLFSLLSFSVKAFALYNGNPSLPMMPEEGSFIPKEVWFGIKLGYEFDFVYDRKLHMQGHHLDHCKKHVRTFDSTGNFGTLTFNFNDRVEIFSMLGGMSFEISHTPLPKTKIAYRTPTHFTWGVGGRAILAYWGDLQLGVNAAYLQVSTPLSSLKVNDKSYPVRHAKLASAQWQIGIGTSYRWHWFIPYFGIDYSDVRTRIEDLDSIEFLIPDEHVTFKDSYPCGIYFGFGLSPYRVFNVNVEARFMNENAFSVSADFKF